MKYSNYILKRKLEAILIAPFVLIGRILHLIKGHKNEYELYFFFPFYHLGGAEKIHLQIAQIAKNKKAVIVFTRKSTNLGFLATFKEIGIDIECINRSVVISKLSHLILSEREQTSLSQLREDKRKEMFLKIWTVKESFFKGLGGGLSLPLKHIEVKFKNDSVVGILNTFAGEFDLVNWQIIIPELNNDLIGAIAINCRSYDIELVNECLPAIISPELDL
jgi:phosphopantetheine--protein transferase-like protein